MNDDNDPNRNSEDENDNDDEEMEDVNEPDQDVDADMDAGGDDDEEDENGDDDDDQNDDDEDEDQNEPDTPSRRLSRHTVPRRSASRERADDSAAAPTSPSTHTTAARPPSRRLESFIPPTRPIALTATAYDIVPTMAAPQSTSIHAITTTPDMRWVFSGGADGYVRMYNWVDTANGRVPLTVAQKHPFVDSVMKAGSLVTYWENEEQATRTPTQGDDSKWLSPVYSLAVQHEAIWLLSGLESGGINMQTCRHQAGSRITTLKEHTSAVSVLALSQDETCLLSGSWDKNIHDWCLNSGKVKRSFKGSSSQISAIETRPMSNVHVPEVSNPLPEPANGTFSTNNADEPLGNSSFANGVNGAGVQLADGEEDASGSPEGSLFGETSLFGEDAGGAGPTFGDDDDDLARALASEMQDIDQDAPGEADTEMTGMGSGGPVQTPENKNPPVSSSTSVAQLDSAADEGQSSHTPHDTHDMKPESLLNGLPRSDEPLTAPPTNEEQKPSAADLPPQSESTFLDAAIDGTIRIWDRRVAQPVATILPIGTTPPWCTGACWSPDGNFLYAGRRNCTVDEYSIHHLGSKRSEPNRTFKFQNGSGPVYAVRAMPNKKHLVW